MPDILVAPAGLLCAGALSAWLTGWLRGYALRHQLLDRPNARSSHTVATPRGGGMAIVITTLLMLSTLGWWLGGLGRATLGIVAGGALAAGIGFADDHRHVARRVRLLAHFAAAACVLVGLGGMHGINVTGFDGPPLWATTLIAALYIVWVLNLTNFMDGIDGIAAAEAITVAAGGAALAAVAGTSPWLVVAPLVLAASTAGFLLWNWPPARIFMGDAGSGFLGLALAALSLQAGTADARLFWGWVTLLGVFVTDATVTLIRRFLRGERIHEAHRSHAYQHAARRHGAHKPVTLGVIAINLVWLLPIALLIATGRASALPATAVAYAPLVALAIALGSGSDSR